MDFQIPTEEQYAKAMLALLPPGKAWPRDTDTNLYKLFYGLAIQVRKVDEKAISQISAAFPATATDYLDEWLELFGLPDKCTTWQSSDEDKRAQVVARLTWTGEATVAFLKTYCATLGYTVDIKEWGGAVCGGARAGKQGCQTSDRLSESIITINILNDKDPTFLQCELQTVLPYLPYHLFSHSSILV